MVRRFALSLVLLGVAGAMTARSQPAKPTVDAEQIVRLVAQLGSPQFADREKANESLTEVGRPALAALERARQGSDPEVRRRAEAIMQRIERRLDTAEVLQPTRVRLAFQNTPLDEAVETVAEKTG